jgi:hypothetical protein
MSDSENLLIGNIDCLAGVNRIVEFVDNEVFAILVTKCFFNLTVVLQETD